MNARRLAQFGFFVCLLGMVALAALLLWHTSGKNAAAAPPVTSPDAAAEILAIPGIRPAIAADVGCGDGQLALALARRGVQLVHGLAGDAAEAQAGRRNALAAGVAGQVTIDVQTGTHLPYADDLLNILIVENYPALRKIGVPFSELWRAVAPFNTLVLGGVADTAGLAKELLAVGVPPEALRHAGQWLWVVKPMPAAMDQWPERYHDAGHVSHDQLVGPATGLRWIQGSIWNGASAGTLGQEIIAADGRTFYADKVYPDKLSADLTARDAFNGTALWTRKIALGAADSAEWAAASGERIFTRLTTDGPVVALNAADGQVLWTSPFSGDFCCSDGLLIIRADSSRWVAFDEANGKQVSQFAVAKTYHDAEAVAAEGMLIALEAGPGEIADAQHVDDPGWRASLFKQAGPARGSLVGFDLKTGAVKWKVANKGDGWPYWLAKGLIMTRDNWGGGKMMVFSAKDGSYLWSQAMGTKMFAWTAAFYMGDTIWGYQPVHAWYQAYDPKTGAVLKRDSGRAKEFGRCAADLATDRWILGQELQLTDFTLGRTFDQFFTRAACTTGYTPAYGLFYNYTHTCACNDYIRGVEGISCTPPPKPDAVADPLAEHGPAFGQALSDAKPAAGDWPTYRHDAFRSGDCSTPVNAAAAAQWTVPLAAPLTPPVAADGAVYVACIEQQRVVALDARDGKVKWDYLAGGRVDTPPTIYRGLAIFGCHDGWVYALRASDGQLAWRVRVAPEDRYISVRGRLESAWPIYGAVLIDHDTVWAAAGRHGDCDGGVWACSLDPATGRVLWRQNLSGYPPYRDQSNTRLIEARGKIPEIPTDAAMATCNPTLVAGMGHTFCNDVLISDGKTIFLGGLGIDAVTHKPGPPVGRAIYTHGVGMPVDNMLPGVYWDRLSWTFAGKADEPAWMSDRTRSTILGNLITVAGDTAYCIKYPNYLSAVPPNAGRGWHVWLSGKGLIAKAMAVAGDRLVLADRIDGPTGNPAGDLRVLSAADGTELGRTSLPAPPCFDGVAIGAGVVVVSLDDGSVVSFPTQPTAVAPPVVAKKTEPVEPELPPIAAALPTGDPRFLLLRRARIAPEAAKDVLSAMADKRYTIVVADAGAATLARLAAAPDAVNAFTARGGWLILWGLEPDGLNSFDKIVGVEHLLRPMELEKVTLTDSAAGLLHGLTSDAVSIDSPEANEVGAHYPAADAWYGAVDYDDIAPFCMLPGPEYWGRPDGKPMTDRWPRNMVNGFTNEFWRMQFVFDLNKDTAHTAIPMRLPRRETIVGFSFFPGPYGRVRKIRLVSDLPGVSPADLNLAGAPGRQNFKVPPMPADTITVQLLDWDPSIAGPLLSVGNLRLLVARSDDFRQRVHPVLNPGLLVSYPRGPGGIVLSQVRPQANSAGAAAKKLPPPQAAWLAAQEVKKRNIMLHLLQGLAATNAAPTTKP